ncbi:hypothetical protein SCHPADRAFT_943755 [Schizopora paradoxa]|uniref:DUF6533 domain-containing protein n=1 Tax=Schizopora paradoxa TaxID=27342 RepID=A0A0H2RIG4_9AGAM|nr:hypothetical protein SCHPADRAFT_943755 [Schizopora paradoxa]
MDPPNEDFRAEINLIGDQYAFSYATVSSLAWLSYDIVITAHREVDAVWRRKWTIGKTFYIISRYYALLNLISYVVVLTDTHMLSHTSIYRGQLLIPFFVDCLLILRLYAMYNGDRKVLAFLISCLVVQTVLLVYSSYSTINEVVILQKTRPFRGCRFIFPQDHPKTYFPWIFAMVAQVIYLAFTLVKYIKTIRMFRSQSSNSRSLWRAIRDSRDLHPVFALFVRDGTAAFLVILAAHSVNVFTMIFVTGPLQRSGRPGHGIKGISQPRTIIPPVRFIKAFVSSSYKYTSQYSPQLAESDTLQRSIISVIS